MFAAILVSTLVASPAAPATDTTDHVAALGKALDAVLASQSHSAAGWNWRGQGAERHLNLGGVIATAVLEAQSVRPDLGSTITLNAYARAITDYYAARPKALPYKGDIEFISGMERHGLAQDIALRASDLFERVRTQSATGGAEFNRIQTGRARNPDLVGYDVALAIRAALAVGDTRFARELGRAAERARIGEVVVASSPWSVTSCGAMAEAYSMLGADFSAVQRSLMDNLLATQSSTGSWGTNDTQATAFALRGLVSTGDRTSLTVPVNRARGWLQRSQDGTGHWPAFHDGWNLAAGERLPLIQAETLVAWIASERLLRKG